MPFHLERPYDLLIFPKNRWGMKRKAKRGNWHGDSRPACSRSMKTQKFRRSACKCYRIHTQMVGVILIFVAQCRIDQIRRNFFQRRPNPKFLVGAKGDPEQFAVAVTHTLGKRNPIKQRRLRQKPPNKPRGHPEQSEGSHRRSEHYPASLT